jgi:hypothetical protein
MCVLDWPPVLRKAGQDRCGFAQEPESKQARMIEQMLDDGGQWTEREAITGREWRRRRTIFRAGAMITAAKRNRRELSRVVMRYPRR